MLPKSLYDSYCFFSSAKFLYDTEKRATRHALSVRTATREAGLAPEQCRAATYLPLISIHVIPVVERVALLSQTVIGSC